MMECGGLFERRLLMKNYEQLASLHSSFPVVEEFLLVAPSKLRRPLPPEKLLILARGPIS